MNTYAYLYGSNLYINLTNRCCNDCTFCLRNNGEGIGEERLWLTAEGSFAEIRDAIDRFSTDSYSEIVFCGYGESTYRLPVMLSLAAYAHTLKKRTRLDTNGLAALICGREIVDDLVGKIDSVSVSLNEYDARLYQQYSRSAYGEGAFDVMLAFAKQCKAAGIETTLTVVDVIPAQDVEKCRVLADSLGIPLRVRAYIG